MKPLKAVLLFAFCGAVCWWVNTLSALVINLDTAYSIDAALRLQTLALLDGELALQKTPLFLRHDWAWGNGAHQVWGLGVSLLRLPFECAARLAGFGAFPDRIVFFFVLFCSAMALFVALGKLESKEDRSLPLVLLFRAILVLVAFTFPAFIALLKTRFMVYEEVVAYGYLWGLLLFSLMIIAQSEDMRYRWTLLLAAAGGMSIFIRPTNFAYGAAAVAAALIANRRRFSIAELSGAALVTAAGAALCLSLNFLRFGSPLEFGHALNISFPSNDIALKFDYPFRTVPLLGAARELVGALFFNEHFNGFAYHRTAFEGWLGPEVRFREFYFTTFAPLTLILALVSLTTLCVSASVAANGRKFLSIGRWALLSFTALFLFYLRTPSISSRYIMDFAPALAGLVIALPYAAKSIVLRYHSSAARIIFYTTVAALAAIESVRLAQSNLLSSHYFDAGARVASYSAVSAIKRKTMAAPAMPSVTSCADVKHDGMYLYQDRGWSNDGECTVEPLTAHFMKTSRCFELLVDTSNAADTDLSALRLKAGLTELKRMPEQEKGDRRHIRFCRTPDQALSATGIDLVFIQWRDLRSTVMVNFDFIKMHEIRGLDGE